jgi:MFS family permease
MIIAAATLPIAGRLADVFGRKKVFMVGMVIFAITSFLCAITSSLWILIIMKAIQGIGGGAVLANSNAIISHVFPSQRRGLAMGINFTVFSVSLAIGAMGGGYLVQFLGWRSIFFVSGIFGVLFLIFSLLTLSEKKISDLGTKHYFDNLGSGIFFLMIVCAMSSLITGLSPVIPGYVSLVLFLIAGVLVVFFVVIELRSPHPLLNLKLYAIPSFAIGSLVRVFIQMINESMFFMVPFYTQESWLFSPVMSGMMLLPFTCALLIFGPLGGHWADRFGAKSITRLGFFIDAVALVFLINLKTPDAAVVPLWTYMQLMLGIFLYGIGSGLVVGPNNSATLQSVPRVYRGVSSGFLFTVGFLSAAASAALCSDIIHLRSQEVKDFSVAMQGAKTDVFYIQLLIAVIGVIVCSFRSKKQGGVNSHEVQAGH